MNYTTYDPTTGEITGVISTSSRELAELNLKNKHYTVGSYDGNRFYIENTLPISKPEDPSTTTTKYMFDYTTKSWVIDQGFTAYASRNERNQLLHNVDIINPIWYSTLTEQQKNDLVAYRQALLDVPQQQGFPTTIMWPTKPEWL